MSLQSHVRSRYPNRVIRICIYVWAFTVTNPSPLAMNREYDLAFNGGLGRQMCLPVPLLHSTDGMKDQLQPKAKRQRKRKLPFGKKPIETDSGIPTALVSTERACSRAQTQTDPTRTISTAPSESKLNFVEPEIEIHEVLSAELQAIFAMMHARAKLEVTYEFGDSAGVAAAAMATGAGVGAVDADASVGVGVMNVPTCTGVDGVGVGVAISPGVQTV
ncbi:hypothetical protein AAF712_011067 [Marasmius tenuissimus]|uniref:Uncharacterized protein n=1 Tax=Marasmius tenuissimus TaxID=585030 RepID=A0ABR2ZNV4_9AGAR